MHAARFIRLLGLTAFLLLVSSPQFFCATQDDAAQKRLRVAVLDFSYSGDDLRNVGREVAGKFHADLKQYARLNLLDTDVTRAAADGFGYINSLNFVREDARALGTALDCDFYFLGRVMTGRSQVPTLSNQTETRAYVFLVSARTGNLVTWSELAVTDALATNALARLQKQLWAEADAFATIIQATDKSERAAEQTHARINSAAAPLIEDAPAPDTPAALGLRLPAPYRRLQPQPTEAARAACIEATVDVAIELDETGEVRRAEIARWAGFGLDEAALTTVKQLHFRPAMRDGAPVPLRVLLRYNFRLRQ